MNKKLMQLTVIGMLVTLTLSGCGGASSNGYKAEEAMTTFAGDYGYEAAEEYASDDIYEYKEVAEEAVEEAVDNDSISDEQLEASNTRKLIKTVNMSVETKEFDSLIANIQEKIVALGGYAESTNISGNSYDANGSRYASIVARIPADRLDSFVNHVETQSNITNKNENAEDVTLTYADIEAHKKSLKIEQDRLYALLEQADSLETIIALESRLTEVRYELEAYESKMRAMKNQIQYSTVYLNVNEVKEYQPEPVTELTFGERLAYEFTSNCASAWDTIESFIIEFIAFLPILLAIVLILAVIGLVIFFVVKLMIFLIRKLLAKNNSKKPKNDKKKINKAAAGDNVAVALESKPNIVDEVKNEDGK